MICAWSGAETRRWRTAVAALTMGLWACSSPEGRPSTAGTSASGAGGASSGSGSLSTGTGPIGGGTGGSSFGGSGGTSSGPIMGTPQQHDAGLTPDAACSGEVRQGERLPLDMYFVLDQSGSMSEMVMGGSKWKVVTDSLIGFLNDPANADIGVGIAYFPLSSAGGSTMCKMGDPGCVCIPFVNICVSNAGGSCTGTDYAMPSVPLSLPPNHAPVAADIAKHMPGGGTPTRPALEGAMQYAQGWAQANTGRKTVVVLATDGDPEGCMQNTPQDVANVAAMALASPAKIQTFVIGVGSSLTSLNLIAQAGGTNMAFLVDTGGNVSQSFTAALNAIRGQATPCDFTIPAQTMQGTIDPTKVNVSITPTGGSGTVSVPRTPDGTAASCGSAPGWYYDDPTMPKSIKLCDATCQSLQGGKVGIEFGCKTIIGPPR